MTGTNKSVQYNNPTGTALIDGVLSGVIWSGPVTYSFPTSSSSYLYSPEKDSGFAAISASQKNEALFALEKSYGTAANDGFSVEGFTNLDVSEGGANTANIRLSQSSMPLTAYAYYPGYADQAGDVWFGVQYGYRTASPGNYAAHTVLHELGHALGLKHGHEAEGSFGVLPSNYDSLEFSVMTYRSYVGGDPSYSYEEYGAPQSYMISDIAALQEVYGANYTTNSGNTVYKWTPQSGVTFVDGQAAITPGDNRIFATLWDGGGTDTFDLTAYTTAVKVDLRPGQSSKFNADQLAYLGGGPNDGYARGNIFNSLLYHENTASLIENVNAGSGNDVLTGNQVTNVLKGNGGNDTLNGDAGDDILDGGSGSDKQIGGSGSDTASYGTSATGIVASLSKPSLNTGIAAGDTYSSIENLSGSSHNDKLFGDASISLLSGGSGDDILVGGAGADKLAGGVGSDTASYETAGAGVVAYLSRPSSNTGDAGGDTYSSIENVLGSKYADKLFGDSTKNVLSGGEGDDVLVGGAGADTLIGGSGSDTASYETADSAVKVYLSKPSGNTGDATGDVFKSIENLIGSRYNDVLYADSGVSTLNGGTGNDILYGNDGADKLVGGVGADTFLFKALSESTTVSYDRIYDFAGSDGDMFDLSAIDASASISGNQSFSWIGVGQFSGQAGELRYDQLAADTNVYGDVNGDNVPDFMIHLVESQSLSSSFFFL
ncbi:M10 family metallopeptidase C-terminal domain-containing protein [Rhizobium sp. CC1099]|uniref:M10 family metallopeptidase C-terminal domain-containing protein n=1 Tax=Rhizobium sp. CC1099 TaxID=3039160 RepID=UPI0024B05BD2|nr:M10 family metallopeptidase C-terminal domain-containing protein [Rhizobium sp. CC1099]WFU86316.1 M10 family metallopeptidase C-terminal domain-containing protein [Rhizobium sp. CC1099]